MMSRRDEALRFWALIEVIGLGAAPLAGVLLARLPGAGLGLGKVLGLLLVTWLVWLGGSSTLIPYGSAERGALDRARLRARAARLGARLGGTPRGRARRAARLVRAPALAPARRARRDGARPAARRLFWGAEAVFLVAFVAMALLVAYSPDVWNTEKPMDMALLNAANRADTFPPQDPWLAGADLNYYYLGHLAMAVLVKLTAVAPDQGYNLAVAALFALTAAAMFTIGATLWGAARGPRGAVRAGLAAVGLVLVAGNLEGARLLIADGGPLREYDWFAASRVIDRHDHGVPVVLVPARRPARARARAAVHAARARVRPAGRARRAAAGAARARAARGRGGRARGRVPLRGQLVVVSRDGRAARARRRSRGCATRAASPRAPRPCAGCCSSWPGACCSCCRSTSRSIRPRAGSGSCRRDAASPAGCATSCCCSARSPRSSRWAYAGRLMATRRPGRNARLDRGRGGVRRLAARGARVRARGAARRRAADRARRAVLRARRSRPRGWSGCSSPAASRACSVPSCSTCATSSTTGRCTA